MKKVCFAVAAVVAVQALAAWYVPNPQIQNVEKDIVYGEHERCRLDVMWPKDGAKGLPVLVWFHGGGLTGGDKFFVPFNDSHIVQVAVRYPFLQKDGSVTADILLDATAQAVVWTLKNVEKYGGDAKKVFVSGHSAGGYITMMLGLDPKWLGKYGVSPADLAGIAPLSGQSTKHFNVRKFSGDEDPQFLPKIDAYAPLAHVAEKAYPPILVVSGDPAANEWKARAEENELLVASLRACGHAKDVGYIRLPMTDHGTMLLPGLMYVQRFIRRLAPAPKGKRK